MTLVLEVLIIWAVGRFRTGDSSGASILATEDSGQNWDLIWTYPDIDDNDYNRLNSVYIVNNTAFYTDQPKKFGETAVRPALSPC